VELLVELLVELWDDEAVGVVEDEDEDEDEEEEVEDDADGSKDWGKIGVVSVMGTNASACRNTPN
jgi:hypothetical protein